MLDYLKLCMKTWKFDYTVLTYKNLDEYIIMSGLCYIIF